MRKGDIAMAYLLIVDDDRDMAEETAEFLRKIGHEVEFRLDTDSGLRAIDAKIPDLLILDVMFPESDSAGFTFARNLAAKFKGKKKPPILMISSINEYFAPGFSSKDIDDAWMPVTEFMEKPVNFEVLKKKIADMLAKSA
jgi:DNA-binding response OmpR family regulator